MSVWTWVLIGLCVVGAGFALFSVVAAVTAALSVKKKVDAIQQRPLFVAMQSLQLQTNRLAHTGKQAAPLMQRAQTAVASMRESVVESGVAQASLAMQQTGAELRELSEELS